MIPEWADERVYELYNEFIETCILKDDSFLTDEKDVFTIDALDDCIHRFIEDKDTTKDSYDNKIKKQFDSASYETLLVFAHANWLWCMAPSDFKRETKRNVPSKILSDKKRVPLRSEIVPNGGIGSAGRYLKQNKPFEIDIIILLAKELKQAVKAGKVNTRDEANALTERFLIKCRYGGDNNDPEFISPEVWELVPEGRHTIYHILLHLCQPKKYEPIYSDSHKNQISWAFETLVPKPLWGVNREEKVSAIRQKVAELLGDDEFTFYDDGVRIIWGGNRNEQRYEFDELNALTYKKTIILYGAPGTGKTHTANELAKELIRAAYLRKTSLEAYLKTVYDDTAINGIAKSRVHHLQLHPNYSYEEFIAGVQLIAGETKPVKGAFLKLIETIEGDTEPYPHILILDEINRIDLSRLFGELFSGLEYRDKEIKIAVGGFSIKVPENLYVIGTMNEIDFSLERVDFALRRRFVWFPYGFDAESLRSMIEQKIKKNKAAVRLNNEDIAAFISNAQSINDKIATMEELGEQYQVGHTFFAEIVDICSRFPEAQGKSYSSIFVSGGPAQVLWDISISPILTAFFGNMDSNARKKQLQSLEAIFLNDGE